MRPINKYKHSVMISIIFFSITVFAGCDSPVDNTDDNSTIHWMVENSPYIITNTTVVDSGTVLIIEPGVTIRFDSMAALIIRGTLIARGTQTDSIQFTAIDTFGQSLRFDRIWGGIIFKNNSNSSILERCIIEYGEEYILRMSDSSPTVSHCILRYILPHAETGGAAILCEGNSFPLIEYNIFSDFSNNLASGVFCLSPSNPRIIYNDIYCSANDHDMAVAGGGFLEGNYLVASVWDGTQSILAPDLSLGEPVDTVGDGTFTTTSTDSIPLFCNVDGVKHPRSEPNFPDAVFK